VNCLQGGRAHPLAGWRRSAALHRNHFTRHLTVRVRSPWCSESAHEYIAQWLRIPYINVTNAAVLHKELFDSANASTYYGALKSLSAADGVRASLPYTDAKIANRNVRDFGCEMSSRGRFATPADFPLRDCSPYSHVHVRRESLRFVHRSRTIASILYLSCPCPTLTLRFATFSFHWFMSRIDTRLPLLTNREVLQLRMEAARYFSWTYSDFIGGFGDILRMTANAVRRLAASVNDQPAREDCLTLDLL
jgi:hypothetical protein